MYSFLHPPQLFHKPCLACILGLDIRLHGSHLRLQHHNFVLNSGSLPKWLLCIVTFAPRESILTYIAHRVTCFRKQLRSCYSYVSFQLLITSSLNKNLNLTWLIRNRILWDPIWTGSCLTPSSNVILSILSIRKIGSFYSLSFCSLYKSPILELHIPPTSNHSG